MIVIVIISIIVNVGLAIYILRKGKKVLPQEFPGPDTKKLRFEFHQFSISSSINLSSLQYSDQSQDWKKSMYDVGRRISENGIQHIVLVHGTFAGDDPLHVFNLIERSLPFAGPITGQVIKKLFKKAKDKIVKDLGNFTPEYIDLLSSSLSHGIKVHEFTWTSGNHHAARLDGAFDLLRYLAKDDHNRFLLIGHSHAGQVFALLSQLLYSPKNRDILLNQAENLGKEKDEILKFVKTLNDNVIDVVTLGTPPRYSWCLSDRFRLIHLVNHRGNNPIGGKLKGMPVTRDGDYIQQLAVHGSDIPSPIKNEQIANIELEELLGTGSNISKWKENIFFRKRLHEQGLNLLIDYKDDDFIPNFYKTNFGHGNYTRYQMMLFNMNLICNHYYA